MITFKEMIGNNSISDIPILHQQNIQELLKRVNVLRSEWNKPMTISSGYRSKVEHQRIYDEKNLKLVKSGRLAVNIPWGSQHLTGAALDIYDPCLLITKWLKENDSKRLFDLNLYAEEGNSNWVHLQLKAPHSGKRWFYP